MLSSGDWKEDARNGHGVYSYVNGDSYEGEWANNLRHGTGTYTFTGSDVRYEGTWVNGHREGFGQIFFDSFKYEGHFSADQVTITVQLNCSSKAIIYVSIA